MSNRSPFIQRLIRSRYLMVVNVLVILFLGMSLGRETVRSRAIDAQIADLQARADNLTKDNQAMLELQTAMQTESFIEREARLKLGLKKPGETVVVLRDDEQDQAQGEETDPTDPLHYVIDPSTGNPADGMQTDIGNPLKWWYYFFDKSTFNDLVAYE
ncbi:septum formation initiator family protein [Candidatus Uhrbacteria bacterium]|nr:septum formation initiator family protein [Candidatus Uhrbacteria bacterium]